MSLPVRVDVLVVEVGPTGLMLAVQLARRSVRVLIVDRNPGPSVATKALGVQARSVEIYARLGIAARAGGRDARQRRTIRPRGASPGR